MSRAAVMLLTAWLAMPAMAEQDDRQQAIEEAEKALEPKVTITEDKRGMVEEYRMNGALYMIKVTPKVGPVYYLVDADGDGELESRRNELDPDVMIPSWMIFRW